MTPVTFNTSVPETPATGPKTTPQATQGPAAQSDTVQLSPVALGQAGLTGRIAANAAAGNLTGDQATQLYAQVSSIHTQILADRQADGGTLSPTDAQAIQQAQSQLSQTVYSDAHNGAAMPSDPAVTRAGQRDAIETGRIVMNEQAGNLSSGQAQQLGSQLSGIQQQIATDERANGGTLSPADAQAINQLQNQLSQQIHDTAHPVTTPLQPANPA